MAKKPKQPRQPGKKPSRGGGGAPPDPVDEKIRQFKAEVGNRQLNPEQAKVYHAFTKKNGKDVYVHVADCDGVVLKITLESSKEVRKILLRHYKTNNGTVTAIQILNMFNVVRYASRKYDSQGNTVYERLQKRNGIKYHTVIKIFSNGNDAVLKSFHSSIGHK